MTKNTKSTLLDTLGFQWVRGTRVSAVVIRLISYFLVTLILVIAVGVIIALLKAVFGWSSYTGSETQSAAIRNIGLFLAAIIGVPFVIWRSAVAQKQVDVTEQGHITDRINNAVEGLGAEKTVKRQRRRKNGKLAYAHDKDNKPDFSKPIMEDITLPKLEVRIGAIYALERIAQDSDRDHLQIMEILCAYIRQNAGRDHVALPEGQPTPKDWRVWGKSGREFLRLDLDVALRVIERRGPRQKNIEDDNQYRLELNRLVLRKSVLSQRDFAEIRLSSADFRGAFLAGANLSGADLSHATLQGARIGQANLQGSHCGGAMFQGAGLEEANLQNANLRGSHLNWVKLSSANLQGADLRHAKLDAHTDLTGAKLKEAAVSFVDFSQLPQITHHINELFGDGTVILPGGLGPNHKDWPSHWPKIELSHSQFETEWRKWQKDPDNYIPPEPQSSEE